MASGRKHWRARLVALAEPGRTLTGSQRRQLRKLLGRRMGREWRIFGNQIRRWRAEVVGGLGAPVSRWVRCPPHKDLPIDALSVVIAVRTKEIGHVGIPERVAA